MSSRANRQVICNRYTLEAVISDTPKTKVCTVADATGRKYAAKITNVNCTEAGSFKDEVEVLKALTNGQLSIGHRSNGQTPEGFPNVYFVGRHASKYDVIVMDMLSPDLYHLCQRKSFSMNTYQNMACEMLNCLKELHRYGFIHCDVKPGNFMLDSRGKVHLIDFGLSRRYRDPKTNAHLPERRERSFYGTYIYSSLNAQRMFTQSRKDDLESLGYALIEMIKKRLPWADQDDSRSDSLQRVANVKESTTLRSLCKGLPTGIYEYMMTVSSLSYSESPDYSSLREMLKSR